MLSLITVLIRFWRALREAVRNPEFRGLTYLVLTTLAAGTVFYHSVEGWRWLDALYFSVITLTTIGYGDFAPKTDLGKIFTIAYVFVGLGLLVGFIQIMGANVIGNARKLGKDEDKR